MKFIRKNGRIIPIKEGKAFSGSHHKAFAVAGVANVLAPAKVKPLFIAAITLTSLTNAVQHGREKGSFWHGVGRHFTNGGAGLAGQLTGAAGAYAAVKGLRSAPVRRAAKGAGDVIARARKSITSGVMRTPYRGTLKNVTPAIKKLAGR